MPVVTLEEMTGIRGYRVRPLPAAWGAAALFMLACRIDAPFRARRVGIARPGHLVCLPGRSRALAAVLLAPVLGFALLWYPAYWTEPSEPRRNRAVEVLYGGLTDALVHADLARYDPEAAILGAGRGAGLPRARAKPAIPAGCRRWASARPPPTMTSWPHGWRALRCRKEYCKKPALVLSW